MMNKPDDLPETDVNEELANRREKPGEDDEVLFIEPLFDGTYDPEVDEEEGVI